jgi:hypothetical protein
MGTMPWPDVPGAVCAAATCIDPAAAAMSSAAKAEAGSRTEVLRACAVREPRELWVSRISISDLGADLPRREGDW